MTAADERQCDEEQLAKLKEGAEVWNAWRQEKTPARIDLAGADLQKADLTDANLQDADLALANLQGACGDNRTRRRLQQS